MAQGVYWIGSDNNIYTKVAGQNGVKNVGPNGITNPKTFNGLTLIDNPSAPAQTTALQSTDGTGSAADIASYDQAINSTNAQLDNLSPEYNNLLQGAANRYQTTINSLEAAKANTDKTYRTNKDTNAQDYVKGKSTIRANTGSAISGIDSVLGSRGGGGQAAGDYATLLASRAGTNQLNEAGTTFGKNEQSLDTGYNDFTTAYNSNKTNAELQKEADQNAATADIQQRRASILQSLADLFGRKTAAAGGNAVAASQPYLNEANSLLASSTRLSAPKPVAAQTPLTYTPPSLASYTTNPTTVTAGGNGATDTSVPFWTTLLNRDKQLRAA